MKTMGEMPFSILRIIQTDSLKDSPKGEVKNMESLSVTNLNKSYGSPGLYSCISVIDTMRTSFSVFHSSIIKYKVYPATEYQS